MTANKNLAALAVIFVNIQFMPDEDKTALLLSVGLEFGEEIIASVPENKRNLSDEMAIYITNSWIEEFGHGKI